MPFTPLQLSTAPSFVETGGVRRLPARLTCLPVRIAQCLGRATTGCRRRHLTAGGHCPARLKGRGPHSPGWGQKAIAATHSPAGGTTLAARPGIRCARAQACSRPGASPCKGSCSPDWPLLDGHSCSLWLLGWPLLLFVLTARALYTGRSHTGCFAAWRARCAAWPVHLWDPGAAGPVPAYRSAGARPARRARPPGRR